MNTGAVAVDVDLDLQRAAKAIARHGATPPRRDWTFAPLKGAPNGLPTVAVDGSHAVLADNGAVWAVAIRAAAVTWPGPRPATPIRIHAGTPGEAHAMLEAAYAASGLEAPRVASAEAWVEALRSLAETEVSLAAIAARPNGQILVDGAIHGLPRHAQALADLILASAGRHGVEILAVAKRSALEGDGTPLVTMLQRTGPAGCWAVDLGGGTFVARLHARADHAFRVDAPGLESVGRLLPMCRDAAYVGYPYALAVAHNQVAITATETADLRARLQGAVRAAGGRAVAAMSDFHEVLDRNVPR